MLNPNREAATKGGSMPGFLQMRIADLMEMRNGELLNHVENQSHSAFRNPKSEIHYAANCF